MIGCLPDPQRCHAQQRKTLELRTVVFSGVEQSLVSVLSPIPEIGNFGRDSHDVSLTVTDGEGECGGRMTSAGIAV